MSSSKRDHYDTLDVPRDASIEQIKAAYRIQLKAFHPDKFSAGTIHAQRAEERIHQIVEAYRTLSNASSRAEYDRFLRGTTIHPSVANNPTHPPSDQSGNLRKGGINPRDPIKRIIERCSVSLSRPDWWKPLVWVPIAVALVIALGLLLWQIRAPLAKTRIIQPEKVTKTDINHPPTEVSPIPPSPSVSARTDEKFDLPSLTRNARKAIVTILTYNANGQPVKTGSGFFISDDGRVVTNRHVINDAKGAVAKTEDGAMYRIAGAFADSAALDLAILKAEAKQVPFLTVQSAAPEVGSRIAIIGSPMALEGSLSEGIVSAIRTDDTGTWIQITAPISPGSSGSPVLNAESKVVGVATLNLGGRFQNLNFARSSQDLAALIAQIAPDKPKVRLLSDLSVTTEATPPTTTSPSPPTDKKYRVDHLPKKVPFLNIRAGPGANFAVVGIFQPTGRGITLGPGRVVNGNTIWQEVFSGSFHGWVNAEYLVAESEETPRGGHNLE